MGKNKVNRVAATSKDAPKARMFGKKSAIGVGTLIVAGLLTLLYKKTERGQAMGAAVKTFAQKVAANRAARLASLPSAAPAAEVQAPAPAGPPAPKKEKESHNPNAKGKGKGK